VYVMCVQMVRVYSVCGLSVYVCLCIYGVCRHVCLCRNNSIVSFSEKTHHHDEYFSIKNLVKEFNLIQKWRCWEVEVVICRWKGQPERLSQSH